VTTPTFKYDWARPVNGTGVTLNQTYLCPDLLSIRHVGEADSWRGKVVRAFFRLLRVVTGV